MVETRPWGRFTILYQDKNTWLKRLIIAPGQSLSLQSHENRSEYWTTQDKWVDAEIQLHEDVPCWKTRLVPGHVYHVGKNKMHRLRNASSVHEVHVLEWAIGSPTESDIIRYQDNYGRTTL